MDLLRADHRARHERRRRPQGQAHEAAPPEAGELVPVAVALADALDALRENPDQLARAQEPLAVLLTRPHRARAGQRRGQEREQREHVEGEHPAFTAGGMLVAQRERDHHAVPRQHAGVVGDDQGRTVGGDVLHSGGLHAPPHRVEELQQRPDRLGELRVAPELVHVFGMPGEVGGAPQRGQVLPREPVPSGLDRARDRDEQAVPAGGLHRRR